MSACRESIFEHHTGNAVTVEPRRDAMSFGLNDHITVSTTRTDHDGCASRLRRTIGRDPDLRLLNLPPAKGGPTIPQPDPLWFNLLLTPREAAIQPQHND